MNYLYYPGCSLKGTGREFEESFLAVCSTLGIGIEELKGWECCGSSVAKSLDKKLAVELTSKTLTVANKQNPDLDLVMLCPACSLNHQLLIQGAKDEESLKKELSIHRIPVIKQFIEVLAFDVEPEEIKKKITRPLTGIRALPYYGCLLVRPLKLHGTVSHENPTVLEDIIGLTGALPINFAYKTDCCGGTLVLTREKVALKMCGKILKEAKAVNPDCIVVSCPLCHLLLDAKQRAVEKELGEKIEIPVLYITQLLGMSLGIDHDSLGIRKLITSPDSFLRKISTL